MDEHESFDNYDLFIVNEPQRNFSENLNQRLLKFSINAIRYLSTLPNNKEYEVFRIQLSKSVTSIGANYEEARGASSRRDFINKLSICLKESRESFYWFNILKELKIGDRLLFKELETESLEILKMFVTSLRTARNKK